MSKFLFYLCGDRNKASSRVRGYWIAEELESLGHKCFMEPHHSKLALLLFALRIHFYDIVVFQKSYSRWHCLLLRWANFWRKKTVLDLDDAPSRTNNIVTLRNVEFMLRNVTSVTVGSKVLFDYASEYSNNVHLIPSSIRLQYYQPMKKKKKLGKVVCVGWIGNGKHYKQDLIAILKEPLIEVTKKFTVRFKLIGACGEQELYNEFSDIGGVELDFIDQIEWSSPVAVATALQDIDVGLYPLLPGGSNIYKCGFKALEYMAMEIPVVSSDVAENKYIINHGVNGIIADTHKEWMDALNRLISDEKMRIDMGQAGRQMVEKRYSIAGATDGILKVLNL